MHILQGLQNLAVMNNNNQKLSPSERELIRTVRNLSHPAESNRKDNQLDVPFIDMFETFFDPTMDAGQSLRAMTYHFSKELSQICSLVLLCRPLIMVS